MITEDYVSLETAKLLKEKGFDEECKVAYFNKTLVDYTMFGFCLGEDLLYCPTLQMAMKWLRKIHNIDIWVEGHNRRYKGYIHSEQRGDEALFYEDSYEEACEKAIKYCLENLI
jgi:hypothetical protein